MCLVSSSVTVIFISALQYHDVLVNTQKRVWRDNFIYWNLASITISQIYTFYRTLYCSAHKCFYIVTTSCLVSTLNKGEFSFCTQIFTSFNSAVQPCHRQHGKYGSQQFFYCCHGPLPSKGSLIEPFLHNGQCLSSDITLLILQHCSSLVAHRHTVSSSSGLWGQTFWKRLELLHWQ